MNASREGQAQGDADAVDELTGADVARTADPFDIESHCIGNGFEQIRRAAGQMKAVKGLLPYGASRAQRRQQVVFLMAEGIQRDAENSSQRTAVAQSG